MKSINSILIFSLILAIALSGCNFPPTANVDIYVTDESGNSVDGATVNAYLGGVEPAVASVTTNSIGYAKLQLVPGDYTFKSYKGNLNGSAQEQIISGQNTVRITIKNTTADTKVSITFLDESGNLIDVKNTDVNYIGIHCPEGGNTCSSSEGKIESNPHIGTRVSSGDYNYIFISQKFESAKLSVTVRIGDNLDLTVTMKKKTKYFAGEYITGLEGAGQFADQKMSIKIDSVYTNGTTGWYLAAATVYDEKANKVSTLSEVGAPMTLATAFKDSTGNYVIKTPIRVKMVDNSSPGKGFIEIAYE